MSVRSSTARWIGEAFKLQARPSRLNTEGKTKVQLRWPTTFSSNDSSIAGCEYRKQLLERQESWQQERLGIQTRIGSTPKVI